MEVDPPGFDFVHRQLFDDSPHQRGVRTESVDAPRIGAIAVTTNTRSSGDELAYFAEHCNAVAAITQPEHAELVAANARSVRWLAVTEHLVDGAPPPANDKDYELWMLPDGGVPASLGVLPRMGEQVFGLTQAQVNALTKYLDTRSTMHIREEVDLPAGLTSEFIYDMCRRLDGFPRHLGIHSGGMVVAQRPLWEVVPLEWGRMEDRSVLQWDKDDCAALRNGTTRISRSSSCLAMRQRRPRAAMPWVRDGCC